MSIRRIVGRIAQLYRYPVKSMAGESLDAVEVSWNGVAGDRRWAFVRPDHQAHGFPWQTIREEPRMWMFSARLRDPDRPEASTVDVRTPDGTELAVTDPLLPDLIGSGL
ncbi:MAG TPA: MOSC N-terminal beta barrel domain-containing protein, partial [Propionibacteriaceae bacterium]|nr:MOSC N-terminal beta barrel domain-containing protein [Propionibacteriaceae bacterium]